MYCIGALQNVVKGCFSKLKCTCCSVHTSAQRLAALLTDNRVDRLDVLPALLNCSSSWLNKTELPVSPTAKSRSFRAQCVVYNKTKSRCGLETLHSKKSSVLNESLPRLYLTPPLVYLLPFRVLQIRADYHPMAFSLWSRRRI